MEDNHIEQYNGREITFKKYFKHRVVNVMELMYVLDIKNKSGRDLLRHGIPKDSIITVPRDKRSYMYYLKREGIAAFIRKYKPEEMEKFMALFDKVIEKEQDGTIEEEKKLQVPKSGDPYALDLLEGILQKVEQMNREAQKFYTASMTLYTRQAILMLETEALYSKVAAILLKAESMGPISRLSKELTKDIITLGKEAFSDAMACEEALKEYENFGKDEEGEEGATDYKTDSDYDSTAIGLLIRADKKHKNYGKRS